MIKLKKLLELRKTKWLQNFLEIIISLLLKNFIYRTLILYLKISNFKIRRLMHKTEIKDKIYDFKLKNCQKNKEFFTCIKFGFICF